MSEKDCGALWLKESKAGQKYMSGVVEIGGVKKQIVVFKNQYKKEVKHPDYRIFESKPRESDQVSDQAEFKDDIPF